MLGIANTTTRDQRSDRRTLAAGRPSSLLEWRSPGPRAPRPLRASIAARSPSGHWLFYRLGRIGSCCERSRSVSSDPATPVATPAESRMLAIPSATRTGPLMALRRCCATRGAPANVHRPGHTTTKSPSANRQARSGGPASAQRSVSAHGPLPREPDFAWRLVLESGRCPVSSYVHARHDQATVWRSCARRGLRQRSTRRFTSRRCSDSPWSRG